MAEMQWSLFVLILMSQASFFTCRHYEYHFVKQKKTWTEAQKYCRDKYTDLAKVLDMTDMERLCDSAQNQDEAWIGLNSPRSESGGHFRVWQWSLPGLEYHEDKKNWLENEPNDKDKPENCVTLRNSEWLDFKCNHEHFFICFDETKKSNNKFHLMKIKKTWLQAQNYCRKNHTDLVSGHQQLEEVKSELKGELETETDWWIGLFRDSWRWSDGSNVSFRFWDPQNYGPLLSDNSDNRCAMTMWQKRGKWGTDKCVTKKHFICYEGEYFWVESLFYFISSSLCQRPHAKLQGQNRNKNSLYNFSCISPAQRHAG
ncbi:C-type mannose receptor 2-like [Plectropomus leopardus]|uniref:C-type mannose receptor 2-like n=1 Tax=Plectropomus leopardus TaxID=160734 RepID=UPI001C4CF778|nr:C-type mannose receptor 2-like [Plectropomus leopardus]